MVKFLPLRNNYCNNATGTVISATITGQLTDITINDGGAGYNNADEITITDSTLQGFGAAAKLQTHQ